jgi:hypothetical protein
MTQAELISEFLRKLAQLIALIEEQKEATR